MDASTDNTTDSQLNQQETAPSTRLNRPRALPRCRFFNTPKGCREGESCRFLHVVKETTPSPPNSRTTSARKANPRRTPPVRSEKSAVELGQQEQQNSRSVNGGFARIDDEEPVPTGPQETAIGGEAKEGGQRNAPKSENRNNRNDRRRNGNRGKKIGFGLQEESQNNPEGGVEGESQVQPPAGANTENASKPNDRRRNGNRPKKNSTRTNQPVSPRGSQNIVERGVVGESQVQTPAPAVANTGNTSRPPQNSANQQQRQSTPARGASARAPVSRPAPKSLEAQLKTTTDPLERAQITRTLELQQIERRYRSEGYHVVRETASETIIHLNLVPSDPDFPYELEYLQLQLHVPAFYPRAQTTLTVLNQEIPSQLVRNVEKRWAKKVTAPIKLPLLAMLNWLDKNLEEFLVEPPEPTMTLTFVSNTPGTESKQAPNAPSSAPAPEEREETPAKDQSDAESEVLSADDFGDEESEEGSDSSSTDGETGFEDDFADLLGIGDERKAGQTDVSSVQQTDDQQQNMGSTTRSHHRGVQIRLVNHQLQNISLLRTHQLGLIIRCSRCKNSTDITNLQPAPLDVGDSGGNAAHNVRVFPCETCQTNLGIRFRGDLVHQSSSSLGYLDLENCSAFDLLPSTFVATCSNCSKEQTPGGHSNTGAAAMSCFKKITRYQPTTLPCFHCHTKMTLAINEVRFIQLAPSGLSSLSERQLADAMMKKKKKKKDDFQLVLGQPLPNNGTCSHYKKSYRWFRFPCCSKLYPCDECHEERKGDGHEMVWANKMVCGFCSREQPYAADKGCSCGKDLTKKDGKGFWEGGRGTRDKVKMNRGDSRKFKGLGKTESQKAKRVGAKK
ncbi:hypothetical protein HK102_000007 [Quaeritorhiza haematococci]|nr:hypothetical protein HK102_000007 [Quaeritorhiza haematococci]